MRTNIKYLLLICALILLEVTYVSAQATIKYIQQIEISNQLKKILTDFFHNESDKEYYSDDIKVVITIGNVHPIDKYRIIAISCNGISDEYDFMYDNIVGTFSYQGHTIDIWGNTSELTDIDLFRILPTTVARRFTIYNELPQETEDGMPIINLLVGGADKPYEQWIYKYYEDGHIIFVSHNIAE